MRDNPAILEGFKEYVSPVLAGHELAGAMVNYEAVALEWFLLGVVELPPHGVTR